MKSVTLLLCSLGLFAQQDAGTRELFFFKKSHPSAVSSQSIRVPVGLRYSILRRNEAGRMAEVDAAGTFHHGDRIRMHFTANQDGYLYVVHQGSSGQWSLLFPTSAQDDYRLTEMRPLTVPQKGEIVFDTKPGAERLFIVGSRQRVESLERFIPGRKTVVGTITTAFLQALNQSGKRDLRVEKVATPPGRPDAEFAIYLVNAAGESSDRVMTEILLRHQ